MATADTASALAFGHVRPEPSGDDESLWAVHLPKNTLAEAMLLGQSDGWHLLRFDGFADTSAAVAGHLSNLSARAPVFLGAYPKAIAL